MDIIEMDYETGEMIKDKLIPDAINWFTGKALEEFEQDQEEYDDDEFDGDFGEGEGLINGFN
jgi:nucleosome assembly protein 1-like 1